MASKIRLILSPGGGDRTAWLLGRYRRHLREHGLPASGWSGLWLAPSFQAVGQVRDRLVNSASGAFLSPAVMTFARLAEIVLGEADSRVRPASPLQRRRLLRRTIAEALHRDQLRYFTAIAQTGGFAALVEELIAEFKQRGVSPQQFQQSRGGRSHRQSDRRRRELAMLYQRYQQHLHDANLEDTQGRLALACHAMRRDKAMPPGSMGMVVVDGFTDFSSIEHDILSLLSRRATTMFLSLPSESPLGRVHLFARTQSTMAELHTRHTRLELQHLPSLEPSGEQSPERSRETWPAKEHLRRNLFRDLHHLEPVTDAVRTSLDRIEIVAASSVENELEEIARRVKMLLVRGVAMPEEIVIALRSVHDVAERIHTVLADFGIPHQINAPVKLASAPLVRGLLAVLRLHADDWPLDRLLDVVTNRAIDCFDGCAKIAGSPVASTATADEDNPEDAPHAKDAAATELRAVVELCIRDAQLPSGKTALLELLAKRAQTATQVDADTGGPIDIRASRAAHAHAALLGLQSLLDALPARAPIAEWASHLESLLHGLGLLPASFSTPFSTPAAAGEGAEIASNQSAWQILRRGLHSIAQVDRWTFGEDENCTVAELGKLLALVATEERLPATHDDVGRVRVVSAQIAREMSPKHLFLAGLVEKAFPAAERPERLFHNHEYQQIERSIGGSGLLAGDGTESAQANAEHANTHSDEMLLFFDLVTSPTDRLTLSYAALDGKAQDLPPSPFLTELERSFGEVPVPRSIQPLGQVVPERSAVAGQRDFRQVAVARALDGDFTPLAGLVQATTAATERASCGESILAAVDCIGSRAAREQFGPFEGMLCSDAVRARLAGQFGPEHLWSPSQLERYAGCPFRFFAEQVLSLQPLTDFVLQSDPRRRGNLVHQTLATMHQTLRDAEASLEQAENLEPELVLRFQQTLGQVIATTPLGGLEQALREIERREVSDWGEPYSKQYAAYLGAQQEMDEPMTPRFFEVRFGPGSRRSTGESDADLSTDEPFLLDLGQGEEGIEQIRITGQIDRIDVGKIAGRTVFNIIDYKSGKAVKLKGTEVAAGRQLQLPLYALATEEMLLADRQAVAWQAGYWNVCEGGFAVKKKGGSALPIRERRADQIETAAAWEELHMQVVDRLRTLIASIRAGQFPVLNDDPHCTGRCPLSTICRVAHIRSLEKQWKSNSN